jgi:hypothetical protein
MAIKTWTGAGANDNWTTALNWSGGTVPLAADDIVFDGVFPITGNKNCNYNNSTTAIASINFTGYTGTFTFSINIVLAGTMTLGAGTTYASSGTIPSYTLNTSGTATLISNSKILPISLNIGAGHTFIVNGNADFAGNFNAAGGVSVLKASTGTTADLRIGGNINLVTANTNVTDYVTIKGYGTAKTFGQNSAAPNSRIAFVSGSSYTSAGATTSGTCYYTVESGGQFNSFSTTSPSASSGTLF